ncbi:Uncharacterised protein [Mycobacterium tuberculosis]|nr:Uncharacterised protein [Mycobacterium tuberculosis]
MSSGAVRPHTRPARTHPAPAARYTHRLAGHELPIPPARCRARARIGWRRRPPRPNVAPDRPVVHAHGHESLSAARAYNLVAIAAAAPHPSPGVSAGRATRPGRQCRWRSPPCAHRRRTGCSPVSSSELRVARSHGTARRAGRGCRRPVRWAPETRAGCLAPVGVRRHGQPTPRSPGAPVRTTSPRQCAGRRRRPGRRPPPATRAR